MGEDTRYLPNMLETFYKSLFTESTVASKKQQRKDKYNEGRPGTATKSMT